MNEERIKEIEKEMEKINIDLKLLGYKEKNHE